MIFGSLSTAVTGLNAQSKALGNISDNIANASTVGYKRIDTRFGDLVLRSLEPSRNPGGVEARAAYANTIQGTSQQVSQTTNLQIQGNGFFSVSKLVTAGNGQTVADPETLYTRDGSFSINGERFLANSSGFALNGYARNATTGQYATTATPIQVTSDVDAAVATKTITLAANLPTEPSKTNPISSTPVEIFDAAGNARTMNINWRPSGAANSWRLSFDTPGALGSKPVDGGLAGFPVAATASTTTAARQARAQTDVVSFAGAGLKLGDTYNVVLNGKTFKVQVTQANASALQDLAGVAQNLADQINGSIPPTGVIAGVINGNLRLTATTGGTPFTTSSSVINGTAVTNATQGPFLTSPTAAEGEKQRFTFTASTIDIGDVFAVDLDGDGTNDASVTVTTANVANLKDVNGVVQVLASRINAAGLFAAAAASGSDLTLTNLVANQTFVTTNTLAPTVSVTNGGTTANAIANTTVIGNIIGAKQVERVALDGVPGDVGAVYSVRLQSPTPIAPAAGDFVRNTAPAANVAEVRTASFGPTGTATQAGEQYSLTIDGSTYSLLITPANQAQYPTRDAVVQQIATQISGDPQGPATATVPNAGLTTELRFTARRTNAAMNVVQPTAANFDQTVSYTTTGNEGSLADVAAQLAAKVTALAGMPISAAVSGDGLVLTANSEGTSFIATPAATPGETPAYIGVTFGGTLPDGSKGDAGAITAIDTSTVGSGNATAVAGNAGNPAVISFQVDYGSGPQTVTLDLGSYNGTNGVTQFQGTDMKVTSLLQDGSPQGTFQDLEINSSGEVVANYDNGRRTILARIPFVMFANANALDRMSGNVFTETVESGEARLADIQTDGAGALMISSLESSNVDIAEEFTKLIVAQRAYTANTRVITTTDEMTTNIINTKR